MNKIDSAEREKIDSAEREKIDRLVKTVSVELIKPLNDDWDHVGTRLRDLRGCMHRLINFGVRASALGDQKSKDVMASGRAGVKEALAEERKYWTSRVGKKYEGSNHDPDRADRLAELALPSAIEDHVASRAAKSYLDARKHMARGDKSLPSAKGGAPIYLRDGHTAWALSKTEEGWELSLKLFPGRAPMTKFAIRVHSASAHADLRRMIGEDAKLGDARVVLNSHAKSGKGQWEARLCYSYTKPKPADGSEILAVHRGMHQFLTLVDTASVGADGLPGDAYLQAKLGFSARRSSLLRHIRKGELGHGARGRGVRRRYKALENLNNAEARMIKSACQQAAARAVSRAQRVGAKLVLIEDYSTIREENATPYLPKWPWAQLKQAIAWACAKAGLEMLEVPAGYISITCPACLNVHTKARDGRMFQCTNAECGLRINIDTCAAINMLRTSGVEIPPGKDSMTPLERLVHHARALAASLRRGKSAAE